MANTTETKSIDQIKAIVSGVIKKWLGDFTTAKGEKRSDTIGGPEHIVIGVSSVEKAKVDQMVWDLERNSLKVTRIKNGEALKVE